MKTRTSLVIIVIFILAILVSIESHAIGKRGISAGIKNRDGNLNDTPIVWGGYVYKCNETFNSKDYRITYNEITNSFEVRCENEIVSNECAYYGEASSSFNEQLEVVNKKEYRVSIVDNKRQTNIKLTQSALNNRTVQVLTENLQKFKSLSDSEIKKIIEKNFNTHSYTDIFNEESINAKMYVIAELYKKLDMDIPDILLRPEAEWQLAGDYFNYHALKHKEWPKIWPIYIRKRLELIKTNRKVIEEDELKGADFYDAVSLLLAMKNYGGNDEKQIALATIKSLKIKGLWEPLKAEAVRFSKKYPDIYIIEDIQE